MPAAASTDLTRRTARLHLDARAADDTRREVRASLSSEEAVPRQGYLEILDHSPGAVETRRAEAGLPLLIDHDGRTQIGVIEKVRLVGRRLEGVARFGSSPAAMERWRDVSAGILRNISVGYVIHASEEEDGGVVRATRWEPFEASLVGVPADPTVGINRAYQEGRMPNPTPTPAAPKRPDPVTAERERIAEIHATAQRFDLPDGMVDAAIREGVALRDFQRKVLDHLGQRDGGDTGAGAARAAMTGEFGGWSDQRRVRDYSIARLVRAAVTSDWREAGLEREVAQELSSRAVRAAQGHYIPSFALAHRNLTDSGAGGAGLVGTDHLGDAFIASLEPEVAVMQLGAQMLHGLTRDVSIPRMASGTTAEWVAEGSGAAESSPSFDTVPLQFKHLTANVRYSKRMAVQADPAVEQLMRNDLRRQVAIGLDRAAIAGAGSATEPQGVLNTPGIGTVALGADGGALDWDAVVSFLEAVDAANAAGGALGFLSNSKVKAQLMRMPKMDGVGYILEMTDRWRAAPNAAPGVTTHPAAMVAGHPAVFLNIVPSDLTKGAGTDLSAMIFGNWQDLMIGDFGGMDLIVDPYTESQAGNVRITVHSHWDIAVRHPESFAAASDIVTA